jgi:hypothetical protein
VCDRAAVLPASPNLRGATRWAFALALAALTGGCGQRAQPSRAAAPAAAPTAAAAPAASGLRVYRDPVTGAFTEAPPPGPGLAPQLAAPSVPPPALAVTSAPGGGKMINLQGTLRSEVKATRGARGADVSCATTSAGPAR